MASTEDIIQRLQESKPPATDHFTYLTIVEKSLSPEILPALETILDDAELTKEIGWDMVEMLVAVPGSDQCLERIARLGNPREVILKVLEVLGKTEDIEGSVGRSKFVTLLGMLGVLHRRLQVKRPSRFIHTTLATVLVAYDASSDSDTAAIVELVRSLSGRKRPNLPTRQSSTNIEMMFTNADSSTPDPEALSSEQPDKSDEKLSQNILQSFLTCVIEKFVGEGQLEWAARLLEFTWPERIVPGRRTMLQTFKEAPELQAKDALIGQLAALADDIGLSKLSKDEMNQILRAPLASDPMQTQNPDTSAIDSVQLSTAGFLCLTAYWLFADDIFDAHYPQPTVAIFPDHHRILHQFLTDDPQSVIMTSPGTLESLITIAVHVIGSVGITGDTNIEVDSDGKGQYMNYHHLITVVSVFHPNLRVRNAATVIAGHVLHADPDPYDRVEILGDLLENCMFATLKACAVTWLREELIAGQKDASDGNPFASAEAVERLERFLFPALDHLSDPSTTVDELWADWTTNAPFHLQVANFAVFLYGGQRVSGQAPPSLKASVEQRYIAPLLDLVKKLENDAEKEKTGEQTISEFWLLKDSLAKVTENQVV